MTIAVQVATGLDGVDDAPSGVGDRVVGRPVHVVVLQFAWSGKRVFIQGLPFQIFCPAERHLHIHRGYLAGQIQKTFELRVFLAVGPTGVDQRCVACPVHDRGEAFAPRC